MIRTVAAMAGALAVAAALAACGETTASAPTAGATASPAAAATSVRPVSIANFSFTPITLAVRAGTPVTWTNSDSVAHTVKSDTGAFDSNTLMPGMAYSFTFRTVGTYRYHCAIHSSMQAMIVVT